MTAIVKIIAQRLALGFLTMFVVSVVIFVAVNLLPGDFAEAILGQGATPEAVEAIRRDLGLDQHPVKRYLSWLAGAVQGDLGNSFAQANLLLLSGQMLALVLLPLQHKLRLALRTRCSLRV